MDLAIYRLLYEGIGTQILCALYSTQYSTYEVPSGWADINTTVLITRSPVQAKAC